MPLRLVKMNRFILGFQRRVWCPKWVPLSSSCFMVTTAIVGHVLVVVGCRPASGDAGPWCLRDARPVVRRDRRHPGMTANWVVLCRHAKSARSRELRLAVYTPDSGAFPQ